MRPPTDAEELLQSLGIEGPEEIDLEAIAFDQGVSIKSRQLRGCEARIVGRQDRAIISIDERVNPSRRRFSIAHELGHWHHHHGRALACRADDIGNPRQHVTNPERIADNYAANLLMPGFLFEPIARQLEQVGVHATRELAERFRTSLTSTAIRLVERGPELSFIVCYGRDGRRWFKRGHGIPERWFPKDYLDEDTFAYDLLYEGLRDSPRHLMDAEAWFDREEANKYELWEESIRVGDDEVLSFLIIEDEDMLEERNRR